MDAIALHEPSLNTVYESIPFPDMQGRVIIMTALRSDLKLLRKILEFRADVEKTLFGCSVFTESPTYPNLVLCGGFIGAPLAAIMLEVLKARGARDFLFCGPCGSLDATMDVGTVFLADAAFADDGTSRHYTAEILVKPCAEYHQVMKAILNTREQRFSRGIMASTDGVFRETATLMSYFQQHNCRAIDMETAALFAVARYLGVKMCSINVISDVFYNQTWLNGIGSRDFKRGRTEAIDIIKEMAVWMLKIIQA